MISKNSIEARNFVKPHLTKMQDKVFNVLVSHGKPLTAIQIGEMLDKKINVITPRLNELLYDFHKIKIVRRTFEIKGRRKNVYALRLEGDPIVDREKSWKEKYFELNDRYMELRKDFDNLEQRKISQLIVEMNDKKLQ